ncbi:MAG: methyltransferase domain-containing protein [Candidatus Hydrogenedentes bacterium]|nr:methyltransferase domain-containing protein [Candidatus Hydrogenedentota bacterium]
MDLPDLDEAQHVQALRGLERIHCMTGGARYFWPRIVDAAREVEGRPLRVLDIATGGGGVLLSLAKRARRAGIPLVLAGCDISERAVAYARRGADDAGAQVNFFAWDVVAQGVPEGFDVILCSLFLHHLEDEQAVTLLKQLSRRAKRTALLLDLVRSKPGYALAYWGCRLAIPSRVVHIDAPLSVMSAFTEQEAQALARRAGLTRYRIERRFPFRFMLEIGRA